MTSHPETYKSRELPGQLEFTSESPAELVKRFASEGYPQLLCVGGPHIATSFFKAGVVDELWLTLEPKIFGKGGNFVVESELDVELKLLEIEKINDRGTMIAKYAVLKESPTS